MIKKIKPLSSQSKINVDNLTIEELKELLKNINKKLESLENK